MFMDRKNQYGQDVSFSNSIIESVRSQSKAQQVIL